MSEMGRAQLFLRIVALIWGKRMNFGFKIQFFRIVCMPETRESVESVSIAGL